MNKDLRLLLIFVLVICLYFSSSCSCNKNNIVEGIGGTTTLACDTTTGYMDDTLTYTCGGEGSYSLNTDDNGVAQTCGKKSYSAPDQTGYLVDAGANLEMPEGLFNVTATCNNSAGWAVEAGAVVGGSRPADDTTGSSVDGTPYVLSGCGECVGDTGAMPDGCMTCGADQQAVTTAGLCTDCISPFAGLNDEALRAALPPGVAVEAVPSALRGVINP